MVKPITTATDTITMDALDARAIIQTTMDILLTIILMARNRFTVLSEIEQINGF